MNIKELKDLIASYPDDTPCAYSLWLPDDVQAVVAESTPVELSDEQVAETLGRVMRHFDANYGINWDSIRSELPDGFDEVEVDVGPPEPVYSLLTLTEDQFYNRYKPETNDDGSLYRPRVWSNPDDAEELKKAVDDNRCWTAVEDDNSNWCIVWGNRVVNRLYNIITERPIENTDWEVQVPDDNAVIIPDHMQELMHKTDTEADEWESMEGPETGVGVEYWYRHIHDGREAYVVDDQGEITLEVSEPKDLCDPPPQSNARAEHPDYPKSDWQYEVANNDSILGYWEWVEHRIESNKE